MGLVPSLSILCVCLLPGLALAAATTQADKPAVLFTGTNGGACAWGVATKLAADGFVLNAAHGARLTIEQARKYNVIVTCGLGQANADYTLPDDVKQNLAVLRQYLEEGGGVLMLPAFGQMLTETPPQTAFFKPLGLTPLEFEAPVDPDSGHHAPPRGRSILRTRRRWRSRR